MFPALAEAAPASHFFDTDESRDVEVVEIAPRTLGSPGPSRAPFLTPRGPLDTSPYLRRRGRRRREQGGLERKEDWADRGGMFGGENRAWKW